MIPGAPPGAPLFPLLCPLPAACPFDIDFLFVLFCQARVSIN